MSDQKPRKTLTIIRKSAPTPSATGESTTTVPRPLKRMITQTPVKKTHSSANPRPRKKKPVRSPSDLRAKELDASLNGFAVWRDKKPLALQFERQVFQHVGQHHLSASKRVVMKLLEWHTANRFYLQAVQEGGKRFNLDGSEAGAILPYEQEYATLKLAKRKK